MDSLLLGLFWLALLSALTSLCVLSEFSLVGSRRTRMMEMAASGNAAAKVVAQVLQTPNRFFAAVQLGITITALATGSVAEPLISGFLEQSLTAYTSEGTWLHAVSATLGSVLGIGFATFFQVVLAELVPRTIALRYAERIALVVVPIMNVIATIARPILFLFEKAAQGVLRLFGIRNANESHGQLYSAAELRMIVEASEKGGAIESDQSTMLNAVFSFGDVTVREVMMPRTEVISVPVGATLAQVVHTFSTHAFSRVPVVDEDLDHTLGILHIKDLLRAMMTTRNLNIRQLMHQPMFVPDTQRADELLQQFRVKHESVAIVLDEYSGAAGLVTLNDLIERIVGEITDSARGESPSIQLTADGAVMNGLTNLGDVNEAFELNLTDENYDTIGGYVMGRLGRIPKLGDEVSVENGADNLLLKVEEMDKLRIAKVRLVKKAN